MFIKARFINSKGEVHCWWTTENFGPIIILKIKKFYNLFFFQVPTYLYFNLNTYYDFVLNMFFIYISYFILNYKFILYKFKKMPSLSIFSGLTDHIILTYHIHSYLINIMILLIFRNKYNFYSFVYCPHNII